MRRILSLFLCILMAAGLCACGKRDEGANISPPGETGESTPTQTASPAAANANLSLFVTYKELKDSEAGQEYCKVTYPVLALRDSDAQKYPKAEQYLKGVNDDFLKYADNMFAQLAPTARQAYLENGEEFKPFYRSMEVYIPRADNRVLSILVKNRYYSGGEGEDSDYTALNFDVASGRELNITDLIYDMSSLRRNIQLSLTENYPDTEFYDLDSGLNKYMENPAAFIWTLGYQGVSFYFNPYDLADGDGGILTVSLRYDNYPNFFSEYYTPVPYEFAVPVIDGVCENFDYDNDGTSENISLECKYDRKNELIESLNIRFNGKVSTVNTNMISMNAYAVYMGPSNAYLFISAENLSGYGYVSIYKLTRSGANLVGMEYYESLQAAEGSSLSKGRQLLTDPDDFIMGSKHEILSTLTALRPYSLGQDGMPKAKRDYYDLQSNITLTGLMEIATFEVDPITGAGTNKSIKLPAGTEYSFWRSDGESYVDMKTDTGECCRLFAKKGENTNVNGTALSACLEGMVF